MASTDKRFIKGHAARITFPIRLGTDFTLVSAAAGLDSEISKDAGTFADCTNEATELATNSGIYYLDLTATEMNADQIVVQIKSSTANTFPVVYEIRLEPSLDSGAAQAGTTNTITLQSGASATDDLYNGALVEIVSGTGAKQIRTITDYNGTSKVATVDRNWATTPDSTSYYTVHPKQGQVLNSSIQASADMVAISGDTAAADALEACYEGWVFQDVIASSASTTTFVGTSASLSSEDDFYNGALVFITSNAKKYLARQVTDYVGLTKTFTVSPAFTSTTGLAGATYVIGGHVE